MAYWLSGFVEVRFEPEDGRNFSEWRTPLHLGPCFLIGDEICRAQQSTPRGGILH